VRRNKTYTLFDTAPYTIISINHSMAIICRDGLMPEMSLKSSASNKESSLHGAFAAPKSQRDVPTVPAPTVPRTLSQSLCQTHKKMATPWLRRGKKLKPHSSQWRMKMLQQPAQQFKPPKQPVRVAIDYSGQKQA